MLSQDGVYSGETTGNYDPQTQTAVQSFQAKYSISTTGIAGPITRAKLNELYSSLPPSPSATASQAEVERQALIAALQAQLAQLLQQLLVLLTEQLERSR
jgi:peptidoglycan hydrolase-like protein with peptidoglycan-binding domain